MAIRSADFREDYANDTECGVRLMGGCGELAQGAGCLGAADRISAVTLAFVLVLF